MSLIKNYFFLSSDDSNELFKAAEIIEDEANDLQQFTRTLNLILNNEEKLKIIELIWKILDSGATENSKSLNLRLAWGTIWTPKYIVFL